MIKPPTTLWDPAEHLETEEDMAAYLEAALEANEPSLIAAALADIAKASSGSPCPPLSASTRGEHLNGANLYNLYN